MADPFTIVAGTVGLLDVCFPVGNYLRDVKAGADKVDDEIQTLSRRVKAIQSVTDSIRTIFEQDLAHATATFPKKQGWTQSLWEEVGENVRSCQVTLVKLFALIELIVGKESPKVLSKLDGLRRFLRNVLTKKSQSMSNHSFTRISEDIQEFRVSLEAQIASLRMSTGSSLEATLYRTLKLAKEVVSFASPNLYFEIPQAACSIFTGRRTELDKVKESLLSPEPYGQPCIQKRFVIFGLGGSGKTELCRRFAQENRKRFWGIFWIDASSDDLATQSFIKIARAAKIEPPTEFAAKTWLANTNSPWLLIIDNADSLKKPIEHYFPEGEMGSIIVTTRDPGLRTLGMPGRRYLHFTELKEDDANDLLLRAADEPTPYSAITYELATQITKKLGYLALALVHAGKAIVTGVCRMHDYLTFFDEHWDRVRSARSRRDFNVQVHDDTYATIYSTYEVMYQGLMAKETPASNDALDLLKTFSFFHHENIRVEILLQAANSQTPERLQQVKQANEERYLYRTTRAKTWLQSLGSVGRAFYMLLVRVGDQPVVPKVLRLTDSEHFDQHRLRMALLELSQMSLITYSSAKDTYSMHPLVHTWVRERPESIAAQAVWCQAAATTLARSILLPPLANTEADEDFRRDLMPHVDHVRQCEQTILKRIASNQKRRRRPWPVLRPQFDRSRLVQLAKFGYIYAQCGLWHDAEEVLTIVYKFLTNALGMQDPMTIHVSLFLSLICRQLDKLSEAAVLQDKAMEACITLWGEDDLQTLEVTDALGVIRWQQGRFSEAGKLHKRAFEGFAKVKGLQDPDTLRAKGNVGRILSKNCEYDEAIKVHSETVSGLKQRLGPSHHDTLSAMDDLAMSHLERSIYNATAGEDLPHAHRIILEVFELRKKRLGKDHPLTLWATANLARVKSGQGHRSEAESLFRAGILVAERNIGPTHIGTLYGKTYLGHVLLCQKRYAEAETLLVSVVKACEESRPNHPDQLVALSFLLKCHTALGNNDDAAKIRERIAEGLERIGGSGHPMEKLLFNAKVEPYDDQGFSSDTINGLTELSDQRIPESEAVG